MSLAAVLRDATEIFTEGQLDATSFSLFISLGTSQLVSPQWLSQSSKVTPLRYQITSVPSPFAWMSSKNGSVCDSLDSSSQQCLLCSSPAKFRCSRCRSISLCSDEHQREVSIMFVFTGKLDADQKCVFFCRRFGLTTSTSADRKAWISISRRWSSRRQTSLSDSQWNLSLR